MLDAICCPELSYVDTHYINLFSFESDYLASEATKSIVEVFVSEGMFIDISLPEDYIRAQAILAS